MVEYIIIRTCNPYPFNYFDHFIKQNKENENNLELIPKSQIKWLWIWLKIYLFVYRKIFMIYEFSL